MKIAVIDKCPSKADYKKYFDFDFELFHMSSQYISKLLKKDIDLIIDTEYFDLIILIGSEAAKEYAGISNVTNMAGHLVNEKYVCLQNPAMLVFKPEVKPDFERALDRIKRLVVGSAQEANSGDYKGIEDPDEAWDFLLEVYNCDSTYITMDTEGTGLYPRDGYVLGLSISHKENFGRYISMDVLYDHHFDLLQKIIDKFIVVFHNMKYDIKMLEYHTTLKFDRSRTEDTMVMHYVLDENALHGLKTLALKYTDFGNYDEELEIFKAEYCKTKGILKEDFTYDLIPFDIISKYASKDTAVAFVIYKKFRPILEANDKLLWVYVNILLRGTHFLNDMEEVGIPISAFRMTAAKEYLEQRVEEAKAALYKFEEVHLLEKDQGEIFNPNSVQQLRKLLFDYLRLPPTGKLTATGAISTDAEVLDELSGLHPLPEAILTIRQLSKMLTTYIVKILPELDRDGRIRTNFNLIFTTSGRLSSSGKFNAQQIPRDDPIIKGCIVAPPGYRIISQDLQTGEMYYAAVLSGDKNLQNVFLSGGDFHSTIAKMVFNLPCKVEEVKELYPDLRQSAKAISFGILYGSGAEKVADTVTKSLKDGKRYSVEQAQDDINAYFTKFHVLKKWLDSRKKFILANGYTYSFFGRKRRLPNAFSVDKGVAAHEVRSGINSEVQSLCSDVNLLGAMDAADEIKREGLDARIFMLVHDSIVTLVHESCVDRVCEILKRNTQKDRGCSIPGKPIGVDQDVGTDYSFGKFDKTYTLVGDKLSRIQTG